MAAHARTAACGGLTAAFLLLPGTAHVETAPVGTEQAPPGTALAVADASATAYSHPIPGLTAEQAELFALGRRMFVNRWAFFWFENAEFGRGPTSNAQACTTCHTDNGRGLVGGTPHLPTVAADGQPLDHHITVPFEPAPNLVVRIGLPGEDAHGGPKPHPQYGDQLQNFGVKGVVAAEGRFTLRWVEETQRLDDGETVLLRRPQMEIVDLGYGALGDEAMTALRLAPPLVGLGLLEAVPETAIEALAARAPVDGIRGKANRVWDESQRQTVLGRFGLKANHGSLREQVAIAFFNDIGLSTPVYPTQNCPPLSRQCPELMTAGKPEITSLRLAATELYVRALAVPARRSAGDAQVQRGERLFEAARCTVCHVPELETGAYPPLPQLAHRTIHPYTDLLLHDMGEGLADGRPDYLASGSEWRTPPLWGIGLSSTVNGGDAFLHDGRARDFAEAILWHGGEAEVSRRAFRRLARAEREALLAFLRSL
jgi:CxxC motif-containing protein (DUF1111 family)